MFRLHFAYMSPYQAFGAQKGVFRVVIGRARHGSDQSGATPPSRSDLPIRATLPERQGEVARVFITRRRENEPGATSRSDTARSLPKPGATYRSDRLRSLRVLFLLELVISQGPFEPPRGGSSLFLEKTTKNLWKVISLNQLITNEHSSRHRVCLGLCPSLSSKLDHPRSNPYIHEFSFPIVKKFKNSSKSLVALRLSDYLHSRCFDISQNWFDNHL
ncbi:hypothetical protein IGI04_006645 [Brassica rapa subsp. trilocularis]|uniref:Uncharacterized protein n=1 Tax=Brassica rapa subsp. trilocularis TaxID=1813537 RepID=A0ABQ7NHG9_BRACM|nr:hypothetical protein IGI04_006645 [Brassica rapa subsp. trilocularis]